jgi:uncharacterized protein
LLKRAARLGKPSLERANVLGRFGSHKDQAGKSAMKSIPMRTVRVVAIAVLLCATGMQAHAEDSPNAAALTAAQELMSTISPDMIKQLTGGIAATFWPLVEQKARADKIDDATIGELRNEFERIQIAFVTEAMKEAPAIYARHFTADELRELTAFYHTPTGAKALRETPQVMGELTAFLVPRLQDLQRQTNDAFIKILHEHGYGK